MICRKRSGLKAGSLIAPEGRVGEGNVKGWATAGGPRQPMQTLEDKHKQPGKVPRKAPSEEGSTLGPGRPLIIQMNSDLLFKRITE